MSDEMPLELTLQIGRYIHLVLHLSILFTNLDAQAGVAERG